MKLVMFCKHYNKANVYFVKYVKDPIFYVRHLQDVMAS